uniref:Cytochrome P450 47 n=1 Tax=Streltzoviella insularis TaxID=1206366 RepID=A0A7D5UMU0_9NEOP|nr:cytochrome P450 47 [Streltzoviella insularis]
MNARGASRAADCKARTRYFLKKFTMNTLDVVTAKRDPIQCLGPVPKGR